MLLSNLKLKLTLLAIVLIFVFPQKVGASDAYSAHYIRIDGEGAEYWTSREVDIESDNEEEIAYAVFQCLFHDEEIDYVPDGAEIKGVRLIDGDLILNVGEELLRYGGNYYERRLIAQIVKTALELPEVKRVSLLIDGERRALSEGGIVWRAESFEDVTQDDSV